MRNKNRIILALTVFLCAFLVIGNFSRVLANQKREVPENPIEGIHSASSQVVWTGKGYYTEHLNDDTQVETPKVEEEILEIEEPEPEEPEKSTEEEPETVTYDEEFADGEGEYSETGDDDANQEGAEVPVEDPDQELYPIVASDLTDGETVGASYRTFYVRGEDYKGNYIGASGLTVHGNGKQLYSTADSGEMVRYRLDMQEGENLISIKVTDKNGRTTTVSYTIYKGEEEEPIPAGTVTFSLEASTVGLGYLIGPSEEVYYEGEQLSYIIDRVLQKYGYTYRYDGSLTNGFYLKHVVSPGITNGFKIPDDLYAKLVEVNCSIEDYHLDSLGEFDFTKSSGWMYFVNESHMSSGISTYYPADGDEIRIRFSLYSGADVGGSMQGEAWGDW